MSRVDEVSTGPICEFTSRNGVHYLTSTRHPSRKQLVSTCGGCCARSRVLLGFQPRCVIICRWIKHYLVPDLAHELITSARSWILSHFTEREDLREPQLDSEDEGKQVHVLASCGNTKNMLKT